MRAFLGGRLDLTQAEAVLALIDSTEQKQFDLALAAVGWWTGESTGGSARSLD